ncbi:MAG: hypothetical protein ACREJT_05260, partial [Myxococcota bacterium]
ADVTAAVGATGSVATAGALLVDASAINSANSKSDLGSGSAGLAIGVSLLRAKVAGGVLAEYDGAVTAAGSVKIHADGSNVAEAKALAVTVGLLLAGTGANARAEVTADADVVAQVGSTAQLSVPGASIDVLANGINSAVASTVVVSVSGLVSVSGALPSALVAGGVQAEFDGTALAASKINVKATGDNTARATATSVGASALVGIAFSGAQATVSDQANVLAAVGATASITVAGTLTIEATGTNDAHADSTIGSGGLFGGVSGATLSATVEGSTRARMDGTVLDASLIKLDATGENSASADALAIAVGLFAGAGITPSALVAESAVVEASLGGSAHVQAANAAIEANATSTDSASADSSGVSVSGLGLTIMNVSAESKGSTLASVGDGARINAHSLTLNAQAFSTRTAVLSSIVVGLLAQATQANTPATDSHGVRAYVGAGADIVTTGDVTILATSTNEGTSSAVLGSGGLG